MITMANVDYRSPLITSFHQPKQLKNEQSIDEVDHPEGNSGSSSHFLTQPRMDSMKIEKNRLESFTHPSWKCFMDRRKLANAGFYYFGVDDQVRCVFCRVVIGKWEPGDDCEVDHQKYSPMCPFLRGFECGNIAIDPSTRPVRPRSEDVCGRIGIEIRPNSAPEHFGTSIDIAPTSGNENVNLKDIGVNPHQGPVHKRYCTEESRIESFKEWPRMMKQKPKDLAEAGFFYTGRSDQTTCFHCGLGLKDWEENDVPWEQHARWYSKCTHVLLNKGHEFIQKVLNKQPPILSREHALELFASRSTANRTSAATSSNIPSSSASSSSESNAECNKKTDQNVDDEQTKVLVDQCSTESSGSSSATTNNTSSSTNTSENKQRQTGDEGCLCQICYLERWNVLFLPCKHALACKKCAPLLTTCPLCREKITATLRIYPSCNHDHRDSS